MPARFQLTRTTRHEPASIHLWEPAAIHLWGTDQVRDWAHEVGLGSVAGAFEKAKIDGPRLLAVSISDVGDSLGIDDEPTIFRVCAAIHPLREQWVRSRRERGLNAQLPTSPKKKLEEDSSSSSWRCLSGRGEQLSAHRGELHVRVGGRVSLPQSAAAL